MSLFPLPSLQLRLSNSNFQMLNNRTLPCVRRVLRHGAHLMLSGAPDLMSDMPDNARLSPEKGRETADVKGRETADRYAAAVATVNRLARQVRPS